MILQPVQAFIKHDRLRHPTGDMRTGQGSRRVVPPSREATLFRTRMAVAGCQARFTSKVMVSPAGSAAEMALIRSISRSGSSPPIRRMRDSHRRWRRGSARSSVRRAGGDRGIDRHRAALPSPSLAPPPLPRDRQSGMPAAWPKTSQAAISIADLA